MKKDIFALIFFASFFYIDNSFGDIGFKKKIANITGKMTAQKEIVIYNYTHKNLIVKICMSNRKGIPMGTFTTINLSPLAKGSSVATFNPIWPKQLYKFSVYISGKERPSITEIEKLENVNYITIRSTTNRRMYLDMTPEMPERPVIEVEQEQQLSKEQLSKMTRKLPMVEAEQKTPKQPSAKLSTEEETVMSVARDTWRKTGYEGEPTSEWVARTRRRLSVPTVAVGHSEPVYKFPSYGVSEEEVMDTARKGWMNKGKTGEPSPEYIAWTRRMMGQ